MYSKIARESGRLEVQKFVIDEAPIMLRTRRVWPAAPKSQNLSAVLGEKTA
jgi:hypothetical protein